jgi:hypothetical protein
VLDQADVSAFVRWYPYWIYMTLERLDRWLPDPAIRTHHRRASLVDPARLWSAALTLSLSDTPLLGRLIRWRIPGTSPDQSYDELFRTYPFIVLEEDERLLISGMCGRIWTMARDYPDLAGPEAFRDWDGSGTVRVLFAHWVERGEGDAFELVSEARVQPVDGRAQRRLRVLWTLVGPFEGLVRTEALKAAVGRAENGVPRSQDGPVRDRPAARPCR